MRRMFAVGRVDRKTTEVRVVQRAQRADVKRVGMPFTAGPFRLSAVVRSTGPRLRVERS